MILFTLLNKGFSYLFEQFHQEVSVVTILVHILLIATNKLKFKKIVTHLYVCVDTLYNIPLIIKLCAIYHKIASNKTSYNNFDSF